MQEAIARMLARYDTRTLDDSTRALREIVQEGALLGLWRAKFFEKPAFYGGTALRVLHGMERFSEDLDFSLLEPSRDLDLDRYTASLREELLAFGFDVRVDPIRKSTRTAIQSTFVKLDTQRELLTIETPGEIAQKVPRGQTLNVKLEVDTDPPPGFATETRYLLHPIPFPVRVFVLPDLFAGKMHAVLCRRWNNRVKGRHWHDMVWFAANHPQLRLAPLEQRMRQTHHWPGPAPLSRGAFLDALDQAIDRLDVEQARREVAPFVKQPQIMAVWSHEFFHDVARRIQTEAFQ